MRTVPLRLDEHITPLVEANTFRGVPGIGPTTDRIARELIHDGTSALVEQSIRAAGKEDAVTKVRGFRRHYLSRAAVHDILARRGTPSRARYRGDFQMHSVWSDGAETLESIIDACLARGHRCAGMTDHSYGLPDCGWHVDGAGGTAAPGDRRAQREVQGTLPDVQGDRDEHPRRRHR